MASRIADVLGGSAGLSIAGGRQPRTRVLAVLPDLDGGGAQRVTLRLLRCLDMQRYDVTLLVLDGPGELSSYVPGCVRLFHAPQRHGLRLGTLATLWHARDADVLIACTELRASYCVQTAARWLRKPSIGWVRIAFDEYAAQLSARHRRRSRDTYGDFDRLVFVSDGARQSFERWYGEQRPAWRTVLNPYQADVPVIGHPRAEPTELSASGRPLLTAIGRLESRKGFDLLIRAAGIARRAGAEFDLAILGEGPLRDVLQTQAQAEGIADRLQMPGFTHYVAQWLRRSRAYVLSSRIEGLPGTILEAFAAGTPVIATRCPHGPEEMLLQGRCGVLVPVDDAAAMAKAIGEVLDSPQRCRELAKAGQQRLRDFAPDVIMPQWQALIDDLVAQRRIA